MDAISGVGKLMEGFAITLDTVIGHAFEDWGTAAGPPGSSRPARLVRRPPGTAPPAGSGASSSTPAAERQAVPQRATAAAASAAGQDEWQEFSAPGGASGSRARQTAGGKENAVVLAAVPAGAGAAKPRPSSAGARQQQPHITSFMSKLDPASEQEVAEWRKRAQQLASELQRVWAQQQYQRLRWGQAGLQGQGRAPRLGDEGSFPWMQSAARHAGG